MTAARTSARAIAARTPYRAGVVTAAFLFAPLVAYLGPLGFAPLAALAGLLLTPLWIRRQAPEPVVLIFAALWIWLAASVAWSPVAPRAVTTEYESVEALTDLKLLLALPLFAALPAAAAGLSGPAARRALLLLGAVLALYGAVLLVEAGSGAGAYRRLAAIFDEPVRPQIVLSNLGRGSVLLAVLALPAGLAFQGRTRAVVVPMLIGAAVLAPVLLDQFSAPAAVLAGGAALFLARRFGPWGVRAVAALLIAVTLGAPWLVLALEGAGAVDALREVAPASSAARLDYWTFAAERIAERPLQGWGLDASRAFPNGFALHPHNASLQLWLELGLHGAILAALIWWWLFELVVRVARTDRLAAGAAAGAATAWFVIANLSFGLWQEWWLGLGALTAAVCAALVRARRWERLGQMPDSPPLRAGELQPL
ncbi:MAG: O-antigen ligase family protein [Pseudomonadota bacterium]|nr:O-antigen ligase family protein [Pseudomonadota bacterium]